MGVLLAWAVVLTNVAYMVPAYVLMRNKSADFSWEAFDFGFTGLISAFYHGCAAPAIYSCPVPYTTLLPLDLVMAMFSITNAVSPFIMRYSRWGRFAYRECMLIATCILVLYAPAIGNNTPAIIVSAVNAVVFTLLIRPCVREGKFPLVYGLMSVICIVVGVVCYGEDQQYSRGDDGYQGLHSLWHVFSAMSAAFILHALPDCDEVAPAVASECASLVTEPYSS